MVMVSFTIFFLQKLLFWDFNFWPLNRGWLLNGGSTAFTKYLNKMVFLCSISHDQCVKAILLHLYFCRVCLLGLMTMEVVLLPF